MRGCKYYHNNKRVVVALSILAAVLITVLIALYTYNKIGPLSKGSSQAAAVSSVNNAVAVNSKAEQKKPQKDYSKLKENIMAYLNNQEGKYSVYFYSINTGGEININADEEFIAASTIKFPINLYLYTKFMSGELSPDDKMTYEDQDYEEGTGDIQYGKKGESYTLGDLSTRSIVDSDNVAINMLIRLLGRSNIYDYRDKIAGHAINRSGNYSTPREMGEYLKEAIRLQKAYPGKVDKLFDDMKHTIFNDRLPAKLPQSVEVAHKIGTQVSAVHDIGVVYGDNPYIIAVMSKDVNEDVAPEVIATINKMVFDFENSK